MSSKVISNIDQLAEAIGSYIGMMKGLEQQTYMDSVLEGAFARTLPAFNAHAAARGLADPRSYGHMWEFGTAGITRGNAKYTPMNENARLWKTVMTGTGTTKNIAFTFKPAKSFNPPQTEEETGVDQDVLDRLKGNTGERKYRFPNKAFVFESGTDVRVLPVRSKVLFIPIKTEGMPAGVKDPSAAEERGYAWAKSHVYSPGEYSGATGQFTAMFGSFWLGTGGEMMFKHMSERVETDLIEIDGTIRTSKRMTPVQASRIKAASKRGESKTRKQFTLKVRQELNERAEVLL